MAWQHLSVNPLNSDRTLNEGEPAADGCNRVMRVIVADDHRGIRLGLSAVHSSHHDIEVVGEAANGLEAVELATHLQPDFVVMDLNMPKLDGVEATKRILSRTSGVRVFGLSMYEEPERGVEILESGAVAYFVKGCATSALLAEMRRLFSRAS